MEIKRYRYEFTVLIDDVLSRRLNFKNKQQTLRAGELTQPQQQCWVQ